MKHSFYHYQLFYLALFGALFLPACTSTKNNPSQILKEQSIEQRNIKLQQIKQWEIKGKIAFIEKDRTSASLNWQVDETNNSQHLNLTSYLGINVLQLTTEKGRHTLKFDGKTYHDNNLNQLLFSLTGLTLPTKALNYWLKGMPYESTDQIHYDSSRLPLNLISSYNGEQWHISYSNYKQIDYVRLANKITIKKDKLLIKIAINEWHITE